MTSRYTLSSLLERQADLLDITPEEHKWAVDRYEHLGRWLLQRLVGRAEADVFAQGSFRLGTVVRPADGGGDFDIDLVFRRDLLKESISQAELKAAAGDLLVDYCSEHGLADPIELGRCWRLDFFDRHFHLDVIPAIPDPSSPPSIQLSDRDLRHWIRSNPIGYADWFYDRMEKTLVEQQVTALAKRLNLSVEQVPRFLVRTPLQRVVQLLKRSRDEFFAGNPEIQPPSILITTLAGLSYRGQPDVSAAILETATAMPDHIQNRDGVWWVENPAHPAENFADKWNTNPERRKAFLAWISSLKSAVETASTFANAERAADHLVPAFGALTKDAAWDLEGREHAIFKASRGEAPAPEEERIEDRYPVVLTDEVAISTEFKDPENLNRYWRRQAARQRRFGKQRSLKFEIVHTTVEKPYQEFWKVRNFGAEARRAGALRGEILDGDGTGVHYERTEYRGDHYVECYIVKHGVCVARTRAWVPIA